MAYSSANLYMTLAAPAGGLISTSTAVTAGGGSLWVYRTTDASSVWSASNYSTDGGSYGMKKYDVVLVINTGSTIFGWAMVTTLSSGYATWGSLPSTS